MPMSYQDTIFSAFLEREREQKITHLENMFQGIRDLLPRIHQPFMPFAHDEVQILVPFPGNQGIVNHAFLILGDGAPAVAVHCLQERE